ncbi:DNA primase [Candidatus Roizmanbacteria bacterium]|nr:DNA primase [Candidatus Roizmanbacteria bacterium]
MNNALEEVKKRVDIVDFIGSFITLRKAGRNFKALCPFHKEKTPSFVISPERQIWHCFGACGEGGDVIKFLMKWENITFFEALRELADKSGVKLRDISYEDSMWKKKERLLRINQLAGEYFTYVLFKTSFGKKALEYLKNRTIKEQTAKKFQLGYAPSSWDSLLQFLKKKNFEEGEIQQAGLAVKGEGSKLYDRFRGRLMFSIFDARGNIVGFSGRNLNEDEEEAKYINTPETPVYHKRETLFGIHVAKEAIKKEKNALLVEGEFDVITPYQQGFENFVAIKGSSVTREQLMLLKRYTERITLALDEDTAGKEAMKRGIEEAERLDFEIEVVQFDFAKDPDEAIRSDAARFKKALKKRLPIYDFVIDQAIKTYPPDDAFNKRKIGDEVLPFIERIRNPIVQSHYIKKVASILDVTEASVETLIRKIKRKKKEQQFLTQSFKKSENGDRERNIQKYLLSLVFQSEESYRIAKKIFEIVSPQDFSIPSYEKIATLYLEFENKHSSKFHLKTFANKLNFELRPVFDEIYLYATYQGELEENVERLAYEIKKIALKKKITELVAVTEHFSKEQEQEVKKLTNQLKEVEKMLLPV